MLPDRSHDLAAGRADSLVELYCGAGTALRACLQCGACTAACGLTDREGLFPRRQMTLVRLGLVDRVAVDPEIWHCYACGECATRCPSGARPNRVMAAMRHMAAERFAYPGDLARLVNDPRRFWLVYAMAAIVLAALVGATGAFTPAPGPLRYEGMLPDGVLIAFFSGFAALALLAALAGAIRAWHAWDGRSHRELSARTMGRALVLATIEILRHRRFADCAENRRRAWAHAAILIGFLGLLGVTAVVATQVPFGLPYPIAVDHPLKLLANAFAVGLVGGAAYSLLARIVDAVHGLSSSFFEWALPANLLIVGLTGVAAESLRFADARVAAYPVYFVHLVFVLALIVTLPYSKLSHATYRLLAVTARKADATPVGLVGRDLTTAESETSPPLAVSAAEAAPAGPHQLAVGRPVDPEMLLGLGHAALAAYSDMEVTGAYYTLRDAATVEGGRRSYPNLRRLHNTPFEREKDRREVRALVGRADTSDVQAWYEEASGRSCTWWMQNHLVARHALGTCLSCGMCTSVCPAAEHYEEYDPRSIVDVALSGDEARIVELLRSDVLWHCTQCGSCTGRCPQENDVMSLILSLRCLAQLKGYHVESVRGRQQYAGRHLWGANLWNRASSIYFRNLSPEDFPDFGPRFARWVEEPDAEYDRLGGCPDMDGTFAGRKVPPATLEELRGCIRVGGALYLWDRIEEHGTRQAAEAGLDLDRYHDKVRTEG